MTFASAKFRALFPAAMFAMTAEFLMTLTDSVVAGHVLGESALAAVNLMQGVFDIVAFVAILVSVGGSVRFTTAIGAFHVRRARGFFTLVLLMSIGFGLLLTAGFAVFRLPVLAALGASREVTELAATFWLWYLPAAALQPLVYFLGTMVYTDGDARLSMISYVAQIVGNCVMSVPLAKAFGIAGCALGTLLGCLAGLAVLVFHFRRSNCQLRLSTHFCLKDVLLVVRTALGDANANIGRAVLLFALNAYVIARFGSRWLPVLAVVLMTICLSGLFDGVGNAAQPLASIYIGERNELLIRRVMRLAARLSLYQGAGAMAILLVWPELMTRLMGLKDPALVREACAAVRFVSGALVGLSFVQLFTSYYVFIGHEVFASVLTLAAVAGMPLVLFLIFGAFGGLTGVWTALGAAPLAALALCAIYLLVRFGVRRFPFLLPGDREANIRVFDLALDPDAVCATSSAVDAYLRTRGIDAGRATRAALLVEEALMVVRERNAGRRVLSEVTVDLNDDALTLVLRDDGEIFDITDADAKIASLRSYLVSTLMTAIPNRRNLTAVGFNRNMFRI